MPGIRIIAFAAADRLPALYPFKEFADAGGLLSYGPDIKELIDLEVKYIDKILMRLTLAGAVYITFVCLLPEFLILKYNVPFYFGGTSLLIIVVVTMDFWAQVQSYIMSQQYESLLKKANFKAS